MSADASRGATLIARLSLCALTACVILGSPAARAQGEGARAFELSPAGSRLLSVYGQFARGNTSFDPGSVTPGTKTEANGGILDYSQTLALRGDALVLDLSLPAGQVRGTLEAAGAERTYTSSGVGDLQLSATLGLVGSPALEEKAYEEYRPRFALSVLTRVYAPTGAYDPSSPVNLGQNRWALQLGLPSAYYLGRSFLDPALTSFELLPSVIWYGDNNKPPQGNHSSQSPLLQLEAHVTRNLNRSLWVSADAFFMGGAETSTDGVSDHNRQRSVDLGATMSVVVTDTVSATLSYTDAVSRNHSGVSAHVIQIIAECSL
jgi:hypothetical protein